MRTRVSSESALRSIPDLPRDFFARKNYNLHREAHVEHKDDLSLALIEFKCFKSLPKPRWLPQVKLEEVRWSVDRWNPKPQGLGFVLPIAILGFQDEIEEIQVNSIPVKITVKTLSVSFKTAYRVIGGFEAFLNADTSPGVRDSFLLAFAPDFHSGMIEIDDPDILSYQVDDYKSGLPTTEIYKLIRNISAEIEKESKVRDVMNS